MAAWNIDLFTNAVSEMVDYDCLITSNHYKYDQCGVIDKFESLYSTHKDTGMPVDFDVIKRCRYLRKLKVEEAQRIVCSMQVAISTMLDNYKPDVIVGEITDQYFHHILYKEAVKRQITVVTPVQSL